MTPEIDIAIKHLAPVRVRPRNGRERIAFDAITTPVRVRGVDPDSLLPVQVDLGIGEPLQRLYRDGRFWQEVHVPEAGVYRPGTLAEAVDTLQRWTGSPMPFFLKPVLPDVLRASLGAYEVPLPDPGRVTWVESLHDIAARRMLRLAEEDLVHDGRHLYIGHTPPFLRVGNGPPHVSLNWRYLSDAVALPLGSTSLIEPALRALGHPEAGIEPHETEALRIARAVDSAFPDRVRGTGDLSVFFAGASALLLDRIAGLGRGDVGPHVAERLGAVAARACIDAVEGAEAHEALDTIMRAAETIARAHPVRRAAAAAERVLAHGRDVVRPRLGEIPTPAEDLDGLAVLVP